MNLRAFYTAAALTAPAIVMGGCAGQQRVEIQPHIALPTSAPAPSAPLILYKPDSTKLGAQLAQVCSPYNKDKVSPQQYQDYANRQPIIASAATERDVDSGFRAGACEAAGR